ncbi:MAG: adenylate kinase family protein [Candidatus Dojkabacteria bacterium]
MTILFHGPSGSGKDTQVELLTKNYEFENIGTGEMFRKMYADGDLEAIKAHQYWSKGLFVPNEIVYEMLGRWMNNFDKNKNWAFVSVVRDVGQIQMFDDLLKMQNRTLDKFIHFTLTEESAIERMSLRLVCTNCDSTYHQKYKPEKIKGYCDKCGTILSQREDDKPDRIVKRLEEYSRTIGPILEEYRKRNILVEIDANPGIEEIHENVVRALNL